MTINKLIFDSVEDVKKSFDKSEINYSNYPKFNALFIKAFLNRLNVGDYQYFVDLRYDFLRSGVNL